MKECTTGGRPADAPYRRLAYKGNGRHIIEGCVDACHDAEMLSPASAEWHNRPDAKRIRRATAKRLEV